VDEPAAPEAEQVVAAVAAPAPEAPATEPTVGPAIKPLVIGQDELPAAERKRGWWKK
jgi:hypothetical protein